MPSIISDPPTKEQVLQVIQDNDTVGTKSIIGSKADAVADKESSIRFILFHAPFSVCSEKVRTVFQATDVPYISHAMDIKHAQDNYRPEYIMLRIVAWLTMASPRPGLAGEGTYEWSGSSSVASNGLDLCVVPTLVDLHPTDGELGTPKVIVDSELIVQYLSRGDTTLCPPQHASLLEKHRRLVDDMPHVAYLYDRNPIEDNRPHYILRLPPGYMHDHQVTCLEKALKDLSNNSKYKDEPLLLRAYQAKLAKTLQGKTQTSMVDEDAKSSDKKDNAYLQQAYDKGMDVLQQLEADLEASPTDWICGTDQPTLADWMELVSLHRLIWLGMNFMWEGHSDNTGGGDSRTTPTLPHVKAFIDKGMMMDGLVDSVVVFDGSSPSPNDSPYIAKKKGWWAGFQNDTTVVVNRIMVELVRMSYKKAPSS